MYYSLNQNELSQLVEYTVANRPILDAALHAQVEAADSWQDELGINTYLLCQILERKVSAGVECQPIIDQVYALQDVMLISIQQLDYEFIHFIMRHVRHPHTVSLEESLVELLSDFSQFKYEKTIRY